MSDGGLDAGAQTGATQTGALEHGGSVTGELWLSLYRGGYPGGKTWFSHRAQLRPDGHVGLTFTTEVHSGLRCQGERQSHGWSRGESHGWSHEGSHGMVELVVLSFLPAHMLKLTPSSRAVEGPGGTGELGIVMSSIHLSHQRTSAHPLNRQRRQRLY